MKATKTSPTPASVLAWWLSEISACLAQRLHSVVLYGSATLDDFCPRWSDVDVCVVLKTPITAEEGQRVGDIHDRMQDRFIRGRDGHWESGQAVEGPYIPIELVSDEMREAPCYTAYGSTRKWAVCHPISPFDRYMLAHFGRLLAGASVSFAPPRRAALVRMAAKDLGALREWDRSEKSAVWLAGMLHWIARSLVFWRDGKMLSKSAALRHEIERNSPFAAAFQLALKIRREGSATASRHDSELREHFGRMALDAAQEIERNMNKFASAQLPGVRRSSPPC
ncbi:MAG: nucleotidyltransferase domain-containing protein [Planctomycetota bacterium]